MKTYTICICDDDSAIRIKLRSMILKFSFKYDIEVEVLELDSAEKLLKFQQPYDILFLDICFNSKNTGIDMAEELRKQGNTAIIILITVLKALSIDGYRAEPLRFVVKPFTENDIETVLNASLCKLNRTLSYIKVTSEFLSELIRTDRILYIYSRHRKRHVVCTNNRIIITWQTLNELMEGLPKEKFVFVHKSYIVNVDMVDTVINDKIKIGDGTIIPLSNHYKEFFMKILLMNSHN